MNVISFQIIVTPQYTRSNQHLFGNTNSFSLLQFVIGSVTDGHPSGVATANVSKCVCNTYLLTKNQL